jgi:hypothetical protein
MLPIILGGVGDTGAKRASQQTNRTDAQRIEPSQLLCLDSVTNTLPRIMITDRSAYSVVGDHNGVFAPVAF